MASTQPYKCCFQRPETPVNGQTMQDATTDQMVYTVGDTLAHISHTSTCSPVISWPPGTPARVVYGRTPPVLLQPGDVVEVDIEGLGVLRKPSIGTKPAAPPS